MDRVKIIAREITWLVPRLIRGIRAGITADSQLTVPQMVTLMRIYEKSSTRVGVLSKEMHVSAPTITGVIDRLVRNGYLRRRHDKKDRRVINVELTNKGKDLVKSLLCEINKRWYRILLRLSEEERERYLKILKRIVEVLSEDNV